MNQPPVKKFFPVALALAVCAPGAIAQIAILQIQVLEGEGAVHAAGSRSQRPITVQVTDETGKPVQGAAVSFRLPEEDTTQFLNGMKTDVQITGPDGRVSLWGIQWGRTPGNLRIRLTAAKDQARAGAIVAQYITDSAVAATGETGTISGLAPARRPRGKWMAIGLIAAGAAAGGVAAMASRKTPGSPTAPPIAVQVGAPTISITRP